MGERPNTRVLSLLATVSGESISKSLHKILPSLLLCLYHKLDRTNAQEYADELSNCEQVLVSVTDELGFRILMDELLGVIGKQTSQAVASNVYTSLAQKGGDAQQELVMRTAGLMMLTAVCANTQANWQSYLSQLLRGLLALLSCSDTFLLQALWDALAAIVKRMNSQHMLDHVSSLRQAMRFALLQHKTIEPLPGLSLTRVSFAPLHVLLV